MKEGNYYLGKKRRQHSEKRKKRANLFFRICFALCLLGLSLLLLLNLLILPHVTALTENKVKNRFGQIVSSEVLRVLSEGEWDYEDFVRLSYDAAGAVRAASVNTVGLNLLKEQVALSVLARLSEDSTVVTVPIGNLSGLLLLSGRGSELSFTVRLSEGVETEICSDFRECGINQTRHTIGFRIRAEVYYLLPTGRHSLSLTATVPATDTVIVGEVPDALTQIMHGEASEADIDDAVDFGCIVN